MFPTPRCLMGMTELLRCLVSGFGPSFNCKNKYKKKTNFRGVFLGSVSRCCVRFAFNVSLAVSVLHCCHLVFSLFLILLVFPCSSSQPPSLALSLSPSLLFSANQFFAFYCLSLPALLWPVKLSPLTKWLMTKVNPPSTPLSFTADSAPCVSLLFIYF